MNRGPDWNLVLACLGFGLSALAFAETAQAADPAPAIPNAASRSRLVVLRPGKDAKARPVVELRRPTTTNASNDLKGSTQGLLARELVRQAVLLAARDELGLATRDEVIGDEVTGGGGDAAGEVVSSFRVADGQTRAFILQEKDGSPEVLLQSGLASGSSADLDDLGKLVAVLETLTRKDFPEALRKLGLDGKANKILAAGTVPKGVEDRLKTLGFVEHVTAIRELHEAIRTLGESPAALGALARGYAQLGALSEFQWHPAHKAFKARALLYAERLVVRLPGSPEALRHRGFVRALVGLPKLARADFEEAKRKAAEKKEAVAVPGWEPLLDAFLGNDTDRLKGHRGEYKSLSALLRLMALEYPSSGALALQAAKDAVVADPECYAAHEAMCRAGGVANLHFATQAGPTTLSLMFPAKLKAVATLPEKVREVLGDREVAILKALDRAGDPAEDAGELSWGVLAHLVRETRFLQVFRRLNFLRNMLSVPADDSWAQARPFVAGHRFWPVLDYLGNPSPDATRALGEFADRLDFSDIETTALLMFRPIAAVRPSAWSSALTFANSHIDRVSRDTALKLDTMTSYGFVQFARTLIDIDPRSTFAMATLIQHDWDRIKNQVPAWEQQEGNAPALLGALGRQYAKLKQYDKAKEMLTRFIKQSPDAWAYKLMAEIEKDQGHLEKWKTTLDEYLAKGEDHGLSHASVRVEIANWFMDQRRWAEAKPYADEAAETWAAWAMSCAVRCHEGLKEWDEAELWLRRLTGRYPSCWSDWYRFCKRTGHGDLDEAREAAVAILDAAGEQAAGADPWTVGHFYWSIGELEQARKVLDPVLKADPLESATPLHLALIVDELKDARRRDELFEQIWTQLQGQAPRASQVCRVFRQWIAAGEKGNPDLSAVDRTIARLKPEHRGDLEFFVGRFLMRHGKPTLGRPYLRRSAASPTTSEWVRILALDAASPPRPNSRPKQKPRKPPAPRREADSRLKT